MVIVVGLASKFFAAKNEIRNIRIMGGHHGVAFCFSDSYNCITKYFLLLHTYVFHYLEG